MLLTRITNFVRGQFNKRLAPHFVDKASASGSGSHDHHDWEHDVMDSYPKTPVVGPGARPGEAPTELNQSAGLRRLEYMANLAGKRIFIKNEGSLTKKHTPADPHLVESYFESRIVGCRGHPGHSHSLLWFHVRKGHIDRCPRCGTCFTIKPLEPFGDMNAHHAEGEQSGSTDKNY